MDTESRTIRASFMIILPVCFLAACSKKGSDPVHCTAQAISATTIASHPCLPEGSITITGPVGSGFSYKIGNGTFQSSPVFSSLTPSTYTITIKEPNGCTSSAPVTVQPTSPGPLFADVKLLFATHCTPCHFGSNPQAGLNWGNPCDILHYWDRIRARAVDGNPAPMPQSGLLPLSERNKISNWINAGHRYTD